MNRASLATGWVRNPIMKSRNLDPTQANSYELGWTWNPITGCLGPYGNGLRCPYCYAHKLANGRLRERYLNNVYGLLLSRSHISNAEFRKHAEDPFYPRFWDNRILDPMTKKEPHGIFACDMSDLFGEGIPEGWTREVLHVIEACPQHRFYLLTKQPQNLPKWSPFPSNCWVGATATDTAQVIRTSTWLEQVNAPVKYLSLEPLQSRVRKIDIRQSKIDWLIIGAQTKPYKPPEIEWVREIVKAATEVGIPVFCKNNLARVGLPYLRQEMPDK